MWGRGEDGWVRGCVGWSVRADVVDGCEAWWGGAGNCREAAGGVCVCGGTVGKHWACRLDNILMG